MDWQNITPEEFFVIYVLAGFISCLVVLFFFNDFDNY